MHVAVAYNDKEGKGFAEDQPFILDEFSGLKDALSKRAEMIAEGYKDVVCFTMGEDAPEEIMWKFVYRNIANLPESMIL